MLTFLKHSGGDVAVVEAGSDAYHRRITDDQNNWDEAPSLALDATLSVELPYEVEADEVVELATLELEAGVYLIAGGAAYGAGELSISVEGDPEDADAILAAAVYPTGAGPNAGSLGDSGRAATVVITEPTTIAVSADATAVDGATVTQLVLVAVPLG